MYGVLMFIMSMKGGCGRDASARGTAVEIQCSNALEKQAKARGRDARRQRAQPLFKEKEGTCVFVWKRSRLPSQRGKRAYVILYGGDVRASLSARVERERK